MLAEMAVEENWILRWRVDREVHIRHSLEKKGVQIRASVVAFTCEFQLRARVVSQMLAGIGHLVCDGSGTCSFADEVVIAWLQSIDPMLNGEYFRWKGGDMDGSQQEK